MKTNKTILGVIGGLAVGAIVGILLAPDKGSNTRKKIIKKSTKASEDIKEQFDNAVNKLTDKYNSLLKKGEDLAEEGKQELNNIQQINK